MKRITPLCMLFAAISFLTPNPAQADTFPLHCSEISKITNGADLEIFSEVCVLFSKENGLLEVQNSLAFLVRKSGSLCEYQGVEFRAHTNNNEAPHLQQPKIYLTKVSGECLDFSGNKAVYLYEMDDHEFAEKIIGDIDGFFAKPDGASWSRHIEAGQLVDVIPMVDALRSGWRAKCSRVDSEIECNIFRLEAGHLRFVYDATSSKPKLNRIFVPVY